tara:strand:- start:848 stop:1288 length:441 start_codon:yes stop_codon:yes gene_type:complete
MSKVTLVNGGTPTTPTAGRVTVFTDSADKKTKQIDDTGTVTDLTGGGGGGAVWTVATEATAARSAASGEFVLIDAATCIVTLPAPVASARVAAKAIAVPATVTSIEVRTSGAGILIDGTDYSATGLALKQYEMVNVISDGTNWFIY